MIFMLYKYNS